MAAVPSQLPSTVSPADEAKFYREGRDWETDRQLRLERSERRAWWVAAAACCVAICLTMALALLTPLKQAVPYVLSVEKATGNVEVMSTADARSIRYQDLLDKHWAQRYVIARESYMWKLLQYDYDTVLAMSADEVGREYAKLYDGPQARDRKFGPSVEMRVEVRSVTLPPDTPGRAVVRFEKRMRRLETNDVEPPQIFVATFSYEYRGSMFGKEKQLIENPLGFRVTTYRVDAEIANAPTQGGR